MRYPTRVTPLQFFIITVNLSFGASMLTLPRIVAEMAHEDMWLPVLIGGLLLFVGLGIALQLAAYFPGKTIIEYNPLLLGNVTGMALNILLILLMILIVSVEIRTFSIVVRVYLLDLTPPLVTVAIFLLPAVYAVQYGLMPVVRMIEFIFLPGYSSFLVVVLLGLLSVDVSNYRPILAAGIIPVLKVVPETWFTYTGAELAAVLLYPFFTRQQAIFRFGATAILFLITVYVLMTGITQGILGPDDTAHLLIPTVMAYRSVEIPDTFIERLDGYLIILWIVLCFCSEIIWVYLCAQAIRQMLQLESIRPIVALIIPFIMYLVHLPPDSQSAEIFGRWTNLLAAFWSFGVLPLLWLLAWRREKRRIG